MTRATRYSQIRGTEVCRKEKEPRGAYPNFLPTDPIQQCTTSLWWHRSPAELWLAHIIIHSLTSSIRKRGVDLTLLMEL